jgi:ribose transport system ATP-binding protein
MLVAKNISKRFGGVIALNNVNLELHPGKVNAIIGENGAGKSTLMKIFSGVHTQYEGEISFKGKVVKFKSTNEAETAGIAIIHQELNLVPHLSIAENIFLGRELTNAVGMVKVKAMNDITAKLLLRLNLNISPETKIVALKVGQQQLVEIAKALHTNAEVIIMDEPTSAISDKEVDNLYEIIDQLKKENKTIVYISHKLKELFAIADRYIVLRDGATIESGNFSEVSQDELIHKMTGRKFNLEKRVSELSVYQPLLSINNLSLKHSLFKSKNILKNISFSLYKGEVLGIYGLMGAGRTELMECIFGLHPKLSTGNISINSQVIAIKKPVDAINAGIALVPEDRKLDGLILNQSIKSNISITALDKILNFGFLLSGAKENKLADNYIAQLGIKCGSSDVPAKTLSGGNQQKIVLAKWLVTNPKILLLDEPTRGIDINAKAEIYKVIKQLASEGMGIIVVSSELPEILTVSDRVVVLAEGELTATLPISEATESSILKHAIQKN